MTLKNLYYCYNIRLNVSDSSSNFNLNWKRLTGLACALALKGYPKLYLQQMCCL